MNVAILGTTGFLKQVVAEIAERNDDQIVFSQSQWKSLELSAIERSAADIVILDGPNDDASLLKSIESLKAYGGKALLVHPFTDAVFTAYEVERLASDAVGRIVPLLPLLQHPAAMALQRAIWESEQNIFSGLGQIERVEMQRAIVTDQQAIVLNAFAEDATLLAAVAGPISEVVAMRAGEDPVPLNVQCTSRSGRLVRWSATRSIPTATAAHLLVEGAEGRLSVRLQASGQWDIVTAASEESFPTDDLTVTCLSAAASDRPSDWQSVTHSLEVREAAEKSLRRGRLVRLNLDGRGEKTAFKGTMASLGCGLLLGGLFLMIFSAAILSVADASGLGRFAHWITKLPWVLAGLMVLFLLIQLLAFVIPRESED